MEKQYSVQFFTSFVENLQRLCQEALFFSQFVEVSGYVCVEIDNMKKERYVLSELLQSSGNVVSESYCTKVSRTAINRMYPNESQCYSQNSNGVRRNSDTLMQRNAPKRSLSNQEPCIGDGNYVVQLKRSSTEPVINVSNPTGHFSNEANLEISDTKRPRFTNESVGSIQQFNIQRHQPKQSSLINRRSSSLGCGELAAQENQVDQPLHKQSNLQLLPDCSVTPVQLFKNNEIHMATQDSSENSTQENVDFKVLDDVIDLDLIDDDLDLQIDEEGCQGSSYEPVYSLENDPWQKKSHLRPGTQIMVKNSVNQFKKFIKDKYHQDIDLFSCPPDKLNMLMLDYFREAKKVDGGELRARTLKCVQERLELYLKDEGYPYSVIKGKEFHSSREYLKQRLLEDGRVASHIYIPVDNNDIETLFQACQLGAHNLETLTNTMWFMNTKYFNIKGPAYHLDLKWGDIVLKIDPLGADYLERPVAHSLPFKVFANPGDPSRCFVNLYKQFRALRPKLSLEDNYAFYLKYNRSSIQCNDGMFLPEPMVYNQLTTIWRKMVAACGLPGNKKIM